MQQQSERDPKQRLALIQKIARELNQQLKKIASNEPDMSFYDAIQACIFQAARSLLAMQKMSGADKDGLLEWGLDCFKSYYLEAVDKSHKPVDE